MMKPYVFLATIWMVPLSTAHADTMMDTASACLAALDQGDRAAFEAQASTILGWRSIFHTKAIAAATECLSSGYGTAWEYHPPSGRFVDASSLAPEKAALALEKAALAADRQRAIDAADAARAQDAENTKALAALITEQTKRRVQNDAALDASVRSACTRLASADDIAAFTNPVCVDIFRRYGLPSQ